MRPTFSVLVPWRGGDDWRERLWLHLRRRWEREHPTAEIVPADSGEKPFNRAASLNLARARAKSDVLLVCDADTWPEQAAVLRDVVARLRTWAIKEPGLWHLTKAQTQRQLNSRRWLNLQGHKRNRGGSPLMCRADAWDAVAGFDERFRGWGGEDTAFHCALRTLVDNEPDHIGTATHLWHPVRKAGGKPTWDGSAFPGGANEQLRERYRDARGDVAAMRALIAERTGWGG